MSKKIEFWMAIAFVGIAINQAIAKDWLDAGTCALLGVYSFVRYLKEASDDS